MKALDLFAGPGGWDVAALGLGIDVLGIEWDDDACATRRAAGLATLQADVAALDPLDFPCDLFIASAPCQAWSMAGKGGGRRDIDLCFQAARDVAVGRDTRAALRERCEDPRSILVVEPLRWALALRPTYIALEQVRTVLPYWRAIGDILREHGYDVWTGILEAERYGVPQTRERAILLARRDGLPAHPPAPTHHRYVPNEPRPEASLDLFGDGLLPWVSMAEALDELGWRDNDLVGFPRRADDGEATEDGYRARDLRPASDPAFVLTEKARSWSRFPAGVAMRANAQSNAAVRRADEPAPTIKGGHDSGDRVWVPPSYDRAGTGAIRVAVAEAAALQSFPPGYPWQGSQTAQFQQVGNAVPPLLAKAILTELVGEALALEREREQAA